MLRKKGSQQRTSNRQSRSAGDCYPSHRGIGFAAIGTKPNQLLDEAKPQTDSADGTIPSRARRQSHSAGRALPQGWIWYSTVFDGGFLITIGVPDGTTAQSSSPGSTVTLAENRTSTIQADTIQRTAEFQATGDQPSPLQEPRADARDR